MSRTIIRGFTGLPGRIALILAVLAGLLAALAGPRDLSATQAVFVDGFVQDPVTGVVEDSYVANGITYTQDQVSGAFSGILYTAEDDERFYFAFAQSVFINDNTYGANSIGWPSKRPHRLSDLLNSDNARVQLYDANGALLYDFRLDYATQDKDTAKVESLGVSGGDGSILVGSPGDISAASSLAWNFNAASPTFPQKLDTSPKRLPTNTYNAGTAADPKYPWIYETVYEWSVPKTRFSGGILGAIKVLEVHNSPVKTANPVPVPILRVKKESNPPSGSSVQVGSTITYTVTATNVGSTALASVVISDKVDPNLNSVVPLDGGTYSSSTKTVTWQKGTLAPGQTVTVRFTATVLAAAAEGAKIYNAATVSSSSLPTPAKTNTTVHTVVATPAIALTKVASPTSIAGPIPGALIKYTYTVTNKGNVTLSNVSVTDDKISGPITLGTTTLAPGASTSGTATHVVTQAEIDAGFVTNTATATGTPPAGGPVSVAAVATVTLGRTPAIALTKTSSSPSLANPGAGDPVTYSYTVTNKGNVTLSGVALADDKIAGSLALSATTLVPGASATATGTYILTQTDIDAGFVLNTATVTGNAPAGTTPATVSATAKATVTLARKPAIAIVKTPNPASLANPSAGDLVTYTYSFTNTGNVTLSTLSLTDNKITGAIPLSPTTLAPGATATGTAVYAVTQADINSGYVANTATVKGTSPAGTTPSTVSASATATVTLGRNPAIALVKTPSVAYLSNPSAGASVGYTYVVTNTGNVTLSSVSLVDNKVTGAISLSATTLAPGASANGSGSYVLTQVDIDAGSVTNVATGTGTAPSGTTPATVSASASATIGLGRNPALSVIKSAVPSTVTAATPGSVVTYTYTVTNTGNVTLSGLSLLDDKTGPVSLTQTLLSPGASVTAQATYALAQSDIDAGSVTNTVDATGIAPNGVTPPTVGGTAMATVAIDQDPAITLSKAITGNADQEGSGDVSAGDILTYTFIATNAGNVTLTNVVIADPLPGMSLSGCAAGVLAPGSSFICSGSYTVTQGDADAGQVANTATATGTPPGAGPDVIGTATETVQVKKASLSLAKNSVVTVITKSVANTASVTAGNAVSVSATKSDSVVVASRITYTLTVTNVGTGNAVGVVLADAVPVGATLVANPDGGAVAAGVVTWTLGSLAAGASVNVSITVEVAA